MRSLDIVSSTPKLRWGLPLIVLLMLVCVGLYRTFSESRASDLLFVYVPTSIMIALAVDYLLLFPRGVNVIHRALRSALEGDLKPIRMSGRLATYFGRIFQDFNVLINNLSSLFHDMEASQLAIIAERNRIDAILRSLPGALLTVDGDFHVTLSNVLAEKLFKLSAGEITGRNLFELLALDEDGRNVLRDAFLGEQQIVNKEITLAEGDAARHFTLNVTFFHRTPGERECGAAVMLQDITDYKRLQEMTRQSEQYLVMGKLAGGVAHELNTPLGTIVGYAQLLNEGTASEAKKLQYGQIIYREAKRCSHIIESLRTFAQRVVCQPESCEINSVVQDVVDTINCCPGRNHKLQILLNLDENITVRGAGGQLDIVVMNVIMNAVQAAASQDADPLVEVETSIRGDVVQLSISDNGPGVPKAQQSRIFDPFFTTKPNGSGLGLGLAISQSIVGRIGGALYLDADYRNGARFILKLPVVRNNGNVAN